MGIRGGRGGQQRAEGCLRFPSRMQLSGLEIAQNLGRVNMFHV